MIAHLSHVMTLANSIIGVSVLAMPFCFKQCGIVLGVLVLLTSSVLSRLACHFLIKSAVMSRRRNFEFLAFHAFGTTGKLLVELFIIGFLLGTCIAFFVVVGDLGPQIIAKMLNKSPEDIRTSVLVTTATFIVFPLGLLRNIDSLSSVCTATIGFYLCLVLKVICESTRHILLGDWYDSVIYWRPAGILQCLPIFSMALFCQTQLFEIYEAIPNVCLEKMNQVVRGALNICTVVYLCVGFFGYVAFCTQPFTGNILMSFEPSLTSDIIKMGFVFSVAFSFPLVIFPCRASLNSLLFRGAHGHDPAINYIPEVRFRWLTFAIVAMSLGTGILIPNIEFLLGIIGSTIGVMICLIFPAAFFIAISTKNTNERLIAQAILFLGMWIMVLCTYANIYAMEDSSNARVLMTTGKPLIDQFNDFPLKEILKEDFSINDINLLQKKEKEKMAETIVKAPEISDVRREPPIPVEREIATEKSPTDSKISNVVSHSPLVGENIDSKFSKNGAKTILKDDQKSNEPPKLILTSDSQEKMKKKKGDEKALDDVAAESKNDILIDSDAIKKEERELEAAAGEVDSASAARREKLRQVLEKHKLEQMEMMQEQKELLKDIKEQKHELEALELGKKRLTEEKNKIDKKIEATEKKDVKIGEADRQNGEVPARQEKQVFRNEVIVEEEKNNVSHEKKTATDEKSVPIEDKAIGKDVPKEKKPSTLEEIVPKEDKASPKKIIGSREAKISSSSPKILDQESRGPILNALTNWTLKKVSDENLELNIIRDNLTENLFKNDTPKRDIPIDLPIALRMSEKTKKFSSVEENLKSNSTNDGVDENLPLRRDILQHADVEKREKREANGEENENEKKNYSKSDKKNENLKISNDDEFQIKNNINLEKSDEIYLRTIDANENSINLATKEQCEMRFTNKNSNIIDENLTTLKKRDLKEFHS